MQSKYSDQAQNNQNKITFALGQKKTFKISSGVYDADISCVQLEFGAQDTGAALALLYRREACLNFQSPCQIRKDSKLYYNVQNLALSQLQYYTNNTKNYFKENPNLPRDVDQKKTGIIDYQKLIPQGPGATRCCISYPFKHFFPFLCKKGQTYIKVDDQLEITMTLGNIVSTLGTLTENATQALVNFDMDDGVNVIINLQKTNIDASNVSSSLCYVYQTDELTRQTQIDLAVENKNQITRYQGLSFSPSSLTFLNASTILTLLLGTPLQVLTSCKIQLNGKNLVLAQDYFSALSQFQTYQDIPLGMFYINLDNIGSAYTIKVQNTGDVDLKISAIIQYEDIEQQREVDVI